MLQQVCKPGQATTALPQQTPKGSHLHVVCIHCCSGCAVLAPHPLRTSNVPDPQTHHTRQQATMCCKLQRWRFRPVDTTPLAGRRRPGQDQITELYAGFR